MSAHHHRNVTLFISTLLVFADACATTAPPPAPPPRKPVQIQAESLEETLRYEKLTLVFPWVIENPNLDPVDFLGFHWTFQINDNQPENGSEPATFTVAPHTGDKFKTSITLAVPEITPEQAKDPYFLWRYTLSGTFKIAPPGIPSEIKRTWRGEILPPNLPTISVRVLGAREDDGSYELNFSATLENPNTFPIRVLAVPCSLLVDGVEVHQEVLVEDQYLEPGTGVEFEVHKTLKEGEHEGLASKLLEQSEIPYTFNCHAQLAHTKVHLPVKGVLTF